MYVPGRTHILTLTHPQYGPNEPPITSLLFGAGMGRGKWRTQKMRPTNHRNRINRHGPWGDCGSSTIEKYKNINKMRNNCAYNATQPGGEWEM